MNNQSVCPFDLKENKIYYSEDNPKDNNTNSYNVNKDIRKNMMIEEIKTYYKDKNIPFGNIDAFIIIHPTKPQENTKNTTDIWSSGYNYITNIDNKKIGVAYLSYNSSVSTIIHEIGHIMGLLDLYSVKNSYFGGNYSPMANYSEKNPPDFFTIEKKWLKWIDEKQVILIDKIGKYDKTLFSSNLFNENKTIAIQIPIDDYSYYMIEYRRNETSIILDNVIPANGLVISIIDEARPDPCSLFGYGVIRVIVITNTIFYDNINGIKIEILEKNTDNFKLSIEKTNINNYKISEVIKYSNYFPMMAILIIIIIILLTYIRILRKEIDKKYLDSYFLRSVFPARTFLYFPLSTVTAPLTTT
jgi:M6 family metalloprotease-like protein